MPDATKVRKAPWRARLKLWRPVAVVLVLLAGVNLLPPDTALAEVRRTGTLRACLPTEYPPLVTTDAARPGLEVEMLQEMARRMELRLALNANSSMGRDINPRNWRLTRAQCQIIAGGILATNATRSYLDTTVPHLEVGWAVINPLGHAKGLEGTKVGFFAGFSGFDRIALGRYLRAAGASVTVINSRTAFEQGLRDGAFDIGITESLGARQIAGDNGWTVQWLSPSLGNVPLALGLWKGDLTLKRAFQKALDGMQADGTLDALRAKYELDQDISGFFSDEPGAAASAGATTQQ